MSKSMVVILLKNSIKKLDKFYSNTSKLINCNPNEISFLQNSTLAWNFFLSSVNLHKEDNVVILDNEYGSNIIGLLNKKIKYKISKINDDGRVCLKNLKRNIDCNTKIVFACHIASQCGDFLVINFLLCVIATFFISCKDGVISFFT